MFKVPLNEIIDKIQEKTGLDRNTVSAKVKEKMEELTGLVSEEGAAHILANEYGVKLLEGIENNRLCIGNIIPDLRNVSIIGRVISQSEVKEWNKGEKKGKLATLLIGDETGKIRVVLWNEVASSIENNDMRGKVILLKYMASRDSNGTVELHSKATSKIEINPQTKDAEKIPEFEIKEEQQFKKSSNFEYVKKELSYASDSELIETKVIVVQVFDRLVFFETCPECRKRANRSNGGWSCGTHNFQTPVYSMVLNAIVDDGSESMRCTFFGNQAETFLGMDINTARTKFPEKLTNEELRNLLGKEFWVKGKINYNSQFDRKELQVRNITNVDYISEAKKIISELNSI